MAKPSCKLLIGQNDISEFLKYKKVFPKGISGGSVYIPQRTSSQITKKEPICPYPGHWNAGMNDPSKSNDVWDDRHISFTVLSNCGRQLLNGLCGSESSPAECEACMGKHQRDLRGADCSEYDLRNFCDTSSQKDIPSIDDYLVTIQGQYCQVSLAFKYCGMGSKDSPRSETYEKYLEEWANNDGDFTFITQLGTMLDSLSKKHGNVTWLFRFEYEVAINSNIFGKNYIDVRKNYCKAFLNCRAKMKETFTDQTKIKFVFHPVVGDAIGICSMMKTQGECTGACVWNNNTCITDPNRPEIEDEDWITLFKEQGPGSLESSGYLPDLLGQSQVFGLKGQYKMSIDNFKNWKLRTGKETIYSETSVASSSPLKCGKGQDASDCTTLKDIMDAVREHDCVDYLVYINTEKNIAETDNTSAIQEMSLEIQNEWKSFIQNNVIQNEIEGFQGSEKDPQTCHISISILCKLILIIIVIGILYIIIR